jgi:hypothetical protein
MSDVCSHWSGAESGSRPFRERLILDDYDGMTVGILSCVSCDATYALELLDWDQRLRRRIFRLATIPNEIVTRYEAKGGRATCKLEIGRLELEALLSQREPTCALVALDMDEPAWLGFAEIATEPVPTGVWGDVVASVEDGRWFERLGLSKER